jgi:hypothetical protein
MFFYDVEHIRSRKSELQKSELRCLNLT